MPKNHINLIKQMDILKKKIVTDKHSFRINENQIDIFDPEIITIGDSQTFGQLITKIHGQIYCLKK